MDHIRTTNARRSRLIAVLLTVACVLSLMFVHNGLIYGRLFAFHFDNFYIIPSLVGTIITGLAFLRLTHRPARTDDQIWLGFYLAAYMIYGLGELFCRMSLFPEAALFWTQLSGVGSAVVGACLFLFALAYTHQSAARYVRTISALLILSCVVVFFYGFSNAIWDNNVSDMKAYPWAFANDAGAGLMPLLLWINSMITIAIVLLIRFRRHTTNPLLRKQSMLFIWAILVPTVLSMITDGVLPAVGILTPPMGMIFGAVSGAVLTYGVLKYQVLTINPALFAESILSIMHESVVVIDPQGKVIFTNPEANQILNLAGSGLNSGSLYSFLENENDSAKITDALVKSRSERSILVDHVDLFNDLKRRTPVRVTVSRLGDEDLDLYVLVMSDITIELQSKSIIERTVRRRTRQLHEARTYLLSSINSLGQGFVLLDDSGKLVHQNEAATSILKQEGAVSGKALFSESVQAMRWNIRLDTAIKDVMRQKEPQRLAASAQDGYFYTVFITPIMSDETVIGTAIILEDVTEPKVMERSRDEFFSIASHELRTPLTAIRGNMSMALHYFPDAMKDDSLQAIVSDTHNASIRLIAIVNDFLDSSRLEQGRMEFKLQVVEAKPLMEGVIKDLGELMKERHNQFKMTGFAELPPLYVDAARFQQILYNIIGNAVKYTDKGTVTVEAESKGGNAHILVSDTGKGISPENQQILFHKFQQATDSMLTRNDTKGTGLGLYISKLLASQMDGDVVLANSVMGRGSVFLIRLPLADKAQIKAAKNQPTV